MGIGHEIRAAQRRRDRAHGRERQAAHRADPLRVQVVELVQRFGGGGDQRARLAHVFAEQ